MAIVTKIYLLEQTEALLAGGTPSASFKFERGLILSYIQQAINARLKSEYFNVTLPSEETIPDGLILATYEDVPVERWKSKSRSLLPAIPVSLKRDMGTYHISDPDYPDEPFIPIQSGLYPFIKTQSLINGLFGHIGYSRENRYIVYTEDITLRENPINKVLMKLVVMDFNQYGDYDILPLNAELGMEIVTNVAQLLSGAPPPDRKVDSISEQPMQVR